MTARPMVLGLLLSLVFVTGAKCSSNELGSLRIALRNEDGVSGGLLDDARSVKGLTGLSADDRVLQGKLLAETDQRILTSASRAMDTTASSARSTADAAAAATASGAQISPAPPRFTRDLEEVTKELVKEQACQAVLDQVAPTPQETGQGQTSTDLVGEVVDRMVQRRWNRPTDRWDRILAWQTYVTGVVQDADQLTQGLLADPSQTTLLARPPVQRAALAYARFCYETPRLP